MTPGTSLTANAINLVSSTSGLTCSRNRLIPRVRLRHVQPNSLAGPQTPFFPPCIIAFPESERWYQHIWKRQKRAEYRRRERFIFLTKASKRHMLRSSGRIPHHRLTDFGVEVVAEGAWVQELFKVETVQQIVGTHIGIGEVVVPVALEIANHQRLAGSNSAEARVNLHQNHRHWH